MFLCEKILSTDELGLRSIEGKLQKARHPSPTPISKYGGANLSKSQLFLLLHLHHLTSFVECKEQHPPCLIEGG